MIVLMPYAAVWVWLTTSYRMFEVYGAVPSLLINLGFHVYLVGRYGGTPGKLMMGLRVRRLDGSNVDYWTAFLRYSVLFLFLLLDVPAKYLAVTSITDGEFLALGRMARMELIAHHMPSWDSLVNICLQVWVWSEFVVLMTNEKRRSLHDFVAGTVVICVPRPTPPSEYRSV